MFQLCDENLDDRTLAEGALELNLAINPDTEIHWAKHKLQQMCQEAEQVLVHEPNDELRLERLIQLFYVEWGYCGDVNTYFNSENAFIEHVLKEKKGIPVTLGAVFLYLCQYMGFPVSAINFPTQLVLQIEWPNKKTQYFNPFDGQYLSQHLMTAWLIGYGGPLATIQPSHLEKVDNSTLLGRLLAVIKTACIREKNFSFALKCSDLALTMVPDDPFEIRDRGLIYQQLHCNDAAKNDLEYFIEQCPNDPSVLLMKEQVQLLLEQHPTVLH
ncbi:MULTISPECIES: SirB1 family protein [Aliivibrio]|uniref:SirB1 family protein n=1 Tax=Aliivibrio TaxID=511678 RepID=UPI00080E1A5A|nr:MULTISPECIES: SirB1 family protein [Aliivibrio]MBD1568268.1 tetratricopeptide repeat protein [Aliivibrio sp. S10_S31]MUH98699.1 tetratricopeptide repeat protein [Aliivibrio fischeri]MUI64103.1 tetratricopeptide repeat protein [Aliivibrio fischeri]OCH11191.1 hypothetical protein A6E11_06185 [Aliivibrio fischeri]OCH12535.1 hypothetical protein A6E09_08080 [Aliivibrio fischeri]